MKVKLTPLTFTMLMMLTALSFSKVTIVEAAKPCRQVNTLPPFITLSGVCAFDVTIDFLVNQEYNILFNCAGDPTAILTTGELKVSLTNDDNGKSIDLNISGPGKLVTNADGSMTQTTYGPWLWFFSPGVLPDFEFAGRKLRMFFISGHMVAQFDSSGNQTGLQIIGGHPVDMCAALQ